MNICKVSLYIKQSPSFASIFQAFGSQSHKSSFSMHLSCVTFRHIHSLYSILFRLLLSWHNSRQKKKLRLCSLTFMIDFVFSIWIIIICNVIYRHTYCYILHLKESSQKRLKLESLTSSFMACPYSSWVFVLSWHLCSTPLLLSGSVHPPPGLQCLNGKHDKKCIIINVSKNLQAKAFNMTCIYTLFLIENSSSDGFLSLRLCRSFFMLLGLLLRSYAQTEQQQTDFSL